MPESIVKPSENDVSSYSNTLNVITTHIKLNLKVDFDLKVIDWL